eukprot:4343744-Amphidinium_carterae.2
MSLQRLVSMMLDILHLPSVQLIAHAISGCVTIVCHTECLGAWTLFWRPCRKAASQLKSTQGQNKLVKGGNCFEFRVGFEGLTPVVVIAVQLDSLKKLPLRQAAQSDDALSHVYKCGITSQGGRGGLDWEGRWQGDLDPWCCRRGRPCSDNR